MHLRKSTDLNSQFTVVRRRTGHGHGHGHGHGSKYEDEDEDEDERARECATGAIASTGASSGSVSMSARHGAATRGAPVQEDWTLSLRQRSTAKLDASPVNREPRAPFLMALHTCPTCRFVLQVKGASRRSAAPGSLKIGGCRTRSLGLLAHQQAVTAHRTVGIPRIFRTRFRAMLGRQLVVQAQSVKPRSHAAA